MKNTVITIDVEEWFHILDCPQAPTMSQWDHLESRLASSLSCLLELFDSTKIKATFFWLGWCAERHPELVRLCTSSGHEVASHTYSHCLPYLMSPAAFKEDIIKAKMILEDITGTPVQGLRAPGFGITAETDWAFDVIREAGYSYDASVFPATRAHGGIPDATLIPHIKQTLGSNITIIPISVLSLLGQRLCLFGGGYLRATPLHFLKWGIQTLHRQDRPLIVYLHPREVDPLHPRLPLPLKRRLKCYYNLQSTYPKLRWICQTQHCTTMSELAEITRTTFAH